jgi:hypothetical protein
MHPPDLKVDELIADRGYDFAPQRRELQARGITPSSPAATPPTDPGSDAAAG